MGERGAVGQPPHHTVPSSSPTLATNGLASRSTPDGHRPGSAGWSLSEETQRQVEVGLVTTPVRLGRASGRVTQLVTGRW